MAKGGAVSPDLTCERILCMNFTEIEHVFVGSTWKRYKNFPIDGANASGVNKWPLHSGCSKYSNITAN